MANWFRLGSAGASTIGDLLGGYLNYKYQNKLMDKQYSLNIKGLKESPLATRQGLETAGYNPITFAGQTNAQASVGTAPGVSSSSLGSNAVNAYQQNRVNEATIENTNANTGLANEQSKTEQAKRVQIEFQNAMLDVEKHLKQKDLDTYDRRFYTQLYEQMQRAENYRAMANVQDYNAQSQRISANAQQMHAQTEREISTFDKQRYQRWMKHHKRQESFLYGAGQWTSTLGKIFSGNASVSAKR